MEDPQIAVISKPPGPKVGWNQAGVSVPELSIFKKWLKHKDDHVKQGEGLAVIQVPIRRLAQSKGRRLSDVALIRQTVESPKNGQIKSASHLEPGQRISDQQVGNIIAVIEVGLPWWTTLVCFLLALCCMMGCFFQMMKKPVPPPEPEPVVEVEEELKPLKKRLQEPAKQGCRLDFERPDGSIHTVYAQFRPLGIHHGSKAPLVANSFNINSYAQDALRVQQGYVVVKIAGDSVKGHDWDTLSSKLNKHLAQFPIWPLEIEFRETLESEPQVVTFVERPIGLEFYRTAPIQVETVSPNSPAAAKGVSNRWYITKIGDKDVRGNDNFKQVRDYLKEGIQPLDPVSSENNETNDKEKQQQLA
jgi:hypothetical protein